MMETKTQHGYLVLADISGYTSFLAGTELEHAHEILTALLETIVGKFKTLLTISKLEGDAVFAFVAESDLTRGETLLEMIESTYIAFRDYADAAYRRTTCPCKACRAIPNLDLKFLTHHGDYIIQNIAGIRELVGSDVNLIHRLLKNHVVENTGWKAYALFTETSLEHLQMTPAGLHKQVESYEHLGDVAVNCMDLHQRYKDIKEAQQIIVHPGDADITFTHDFPAPPPVIWDWLNAPEKRPLWGGFDEFQVVRGPGGRTGPGTLNHCIHNAKVLNSEKIVDWRPFDYMTQETKMGPMRQTYKIEPLGDGRSTRMKMFVLGRMPLPGFIRKWLIDFLYNRMFGMEVLLDKMEALIIKEQQDNGKTK
jgi:hypothetical protein